MQVIIYYLYCHVLLDSMLQPNLMNELSHFCLIIKPQNNLVAEHHPQFSICLFTNMSVRAMILGNNLWSKFRFFAPLLYIIWGYSPYNLVQVLCTINVMPWSKSLTPFIGTSSWSNYGRCPCTPLKFEIYFMYCNLALVIIISSAMS